MSQPRMLDAKFDSLVVIYLPNNSRFRLLQCEDLLRFSALYHCEFNIIEFQTAVCTKQTIWRHDGLLLVFSSIL